ncbi:MAG TPA: DEAD/DEAH box helicase [Hyphomicrobiaceae bacterium]|nr:DEAD/DEAH box helicase [Hyphomicrobiaceae bacterium]
MTFVDLELSETVLRAVTDAGYTKPTPIQEQAIPIILMGRDVLGCAQTGTGKTASFTLPMIDILAAGRAKARMPRSLILEPTRELAAQVAENFDMYGKYNKLSKALLIGGESMAEQIKVLERGADVLIATPGRLLDVFDRGRLLLNDVRILVIDEADRMLDMGFIPDVERIVSLVSRMRQTLLFSATMPPAIRRLADAFLTNPKEITVAPPSTPAETVTQGLVIVPHGGQGGLKEKRAALRTLIRSEDVRTALIFCNRKRDVGVLHRSLLRHGFDAGLLHGDLAQSQRTEVLEAEEFFSEGQKGSSAMPHKRNPVLTENITGLARMVRSFCLPAMENVALWHERDISHSSVERMIGPDATVTLDFALNRLAGVIENLVVYPENMRRNLDRLGGLIHSQRVLLALTQAGVSREEAYALVQRNAMPVWRGEGDFLTLLKADKDVAKTLKTKDLEALFDLGYHLKHVDTIFARVFRTG